MLLLTAAAVGGLWLLTVALHVLLPFALAAVWAYMLAPVVAWLERRHLPRAWGVVLTYAAAGVLMTGGFLYLGPVVARQFLLVAHSLPRLAAQAQRVWDAALRRFHEAPLPGAVRAAIGAWAGGIKRRGALTLIRGPALVLGLVPGVVALLVSPVLAFYLLKDLETVKRRWWDFVPVAWHAAVYKLGLDLDRVLASYIRGQLLVACAVGILAAALTALLGIPFAILIGLLAAVTDVVPTEVLVARLAREYRAARARILENAP